MPRDRTNNGDPASDIPEATGAYRPPQPYQETQTLAGKLIPVVDRIRNLATIYGVRVYRVYVVHGYWSGGRKGRGEEIVTSRRELLPVPRVRDLNTVRRVPYATGVSEEGDIIVDQISARYTEDDLMGRTPDLVDPAKPRTKQKGGFVYYEIQENRGSKPLPPPRRFSVPVAAPMLTRGASQWTLVLTKQQYDRGRNGDLDDAAAE